MATSSFDKPASKAREFISPSDLTFSWNGCHRCLWLNYNHGVKAPSFMPLVGELSAMQDTNKKLDSDKKLIGVIKRRDVLRMISEDYKKNLENMKDHTKKII